MDHVSNAMRAQAAYQRSFAAAMRAGSWGYRTAQERNREEYARGYIDLAEYERREERRLAREVVSPLSETAA